MTNIIYKNEIIKRKFFEYLINSRGFSKATIGCYEKAIWLWEDFTNKTDFIGFNKTKAEEFKTWLKDKRKTHSEESVSLSYCYDNLRHLKTFFEWLSKQAGYKKINSTDIDYFNLSKGEVRIATQPKGKVSPTLNEIKTLIESIQGKTEIGMRDKALISLTFLTGARISAILSLPMKSFDKENLIIHQDPTYGVKTKFSKKIVSALIPFSYKEPLNYFIEWFDYLEKQKNFQPNDPIFPATKIENGKINLGYYNTQEVEPFFWKSTTSVRKIFEKRFIQAGIKYYHPHTFRHLLIKEISKLPLTEEQKKAISQNLGHEDVGTTFGSYGYGKIDEERQVEIIRNIDFEGKNNKVIYQIGQDDLRQFIKESEDRKS
jgi:integrase